MVLYIVLEYLSVVTDALDTTGSQCTQEIRNATQTMYAWWGQPDQRPVLQKMFKYVGNKYS